MKKMQRPRKRNTETSNPAEFEQTESKMRIPNQKNWNQKSNHYHHVCAYIQTYIHVCVYIYIHIYAYMYMHIYVHIYIVAHIYTYTYIQMYTRTPR